MIEKIGIIGGTGKMGSSFKKKFEKIGHNVFISDETSKDKELEILNLLRITSQIIFFQVVASYIDSSMYDAHT